MLEERYASAVGSQTSYLWHDGPVGNVEIELRREFRLRVLRHVVWQMGREVIGWDMDHGRRQSTAATINGGDGSCDHMRRGPRLRAIMTDLKSRVAMIAADDQIWTQPWWRWLAVATVEDCERRVIGASYGAVAVVRMLAQPKQH
ncbi:uncharacterized protein A4U43_C04F15250 [Asparagus officinalis]|uniref:Uncharacterized protein n=1 Tax=Asparagus officinalis TaxID=4686 RepID=A0A5P1F115_ASPOF|nr:uncharacterized protein A4U43_C04F15250 [Asparagus officinalis]